MGSIFAAEVEAVPEIEAPARTREKPAKQKLHRTEGERPRRRSDAFNAFYTENLRETGLIKDADEWEAFIDCLNRPLPSTLWITPTAHDATEVRAILQEYQRTAETVAQTVAENADEDLQLRPLCWMPDEMGWRVDVPKAILRKDPRFKPLHAMLIEHTAKGTINRMEEVSMLPVAVLGIGAGHCCLDMCASPGNKTAQMLSNLADANFKRWGRGLEAISTKEVLSCQHLLHGRIDYSKREGCVIANDISVERSGMLVHQIARHQSLYPLVMFTSHDARFFPSIRSPEGLEVQFDRILCDVMCSSDGTLRKSPHLWREWSPKQSLELHRDQLAVALRAARLLKVGGQMAYSTCSMSPIEDEAVVAELLRCTRSSLKLVDCRQRLAPLLTREGLRCWKVSHPNGRHLYNSYAEVQHPGRHKLLQASNFPPPMDSALSSELSKCIRVLPHDNDTGGFFIALFEKVASVPPEQEDEEGVARAYDSDRDEDGEELERERQLQRLEEAVATGKSEQERLKATTRRERAKSSGSLARELARYLSLPNAMPQHPVSLRSTFGLDATFPMELLFCRYHLELNSDGEQVRTHEGEANQIILCAGRTADLLTWGTGEHAKRKLKVIAGGLRAFEKDRFEVSERTSQFRFAQEALELIVPYVGQRLVDLEDPADMRRLLGSCRDAPTAVLVSAGRSQLEALSPGGCILLLCAENGKRLPVSALRTHRAVNLFVNDLQMPALRKACGLPAQPAPEAVFAEEAL